MSELSTLELQKKIDILSKKLNQEKENYLNIQLEMNKIKIQAGEHIGALRIQLASCKCKRVAPSPGTHDSEWGKK